MMAAKALEKNVSVGDARLTEAIEEVKAVKEANMSVSKGGGSGTDGSCAKNTCP